MARQKIKSNFVSKAQEKRYVSARQRIIEQLFEIAEHACDCTTFEQLSKLTGISSNTLANWYYSRVKYPRLDTILKFAEGVGVVASGLFQIEKGTPVLRVPVSAKPKRRKSYHSSEPIVEYNSGTVFDKGFQPHPSVSERRA